MLLALQIEPSWLFAAGIALATWLLLRMAYRRRSKVAKSTISSFPSTRRAVVSQFHQPLTDAPPEIVRWQVEMHDTARDLKAELDSKISIIQTLVAMAREERQQLEEAIQRAEQLGLLSSREPCNEYKVGPAAGSSVEREASPKS